MPARIIGAEIRIKNGKMFSDASRSPRANAVIDNIAPHNSHSPPPRLDNNVSIAAGRVETGPARIAIHDEIGSPLRKRNIAWSAMLRCHTPSAIASNTAARKAGFI
jgi:hypothetical protein